MQIVGILLEQIKRKELADFRNNSRSGEDLFPCLSGSLSRSPSLGVFFLPYSPSTSLCAEACPVYPAFSVA